MGTDEHFGEYDLEGNPITMAQWLAIRREGGRDVGRVAFTQVDEAVSVSTIWMGIDMGLGAEIHAKYYPDEPYVPLIFETMVFADPGDDLQHHCVRYGSREDALNGHDEVVGMIRTLRASERSDGLPAPVWLRKVDHEAQHDA